MPAGVVELQHDPLVLARAGRFCEVGQHEFEQRLADRVGNIPHGRTARRLDEACHIEPFETMVAERDGALADGRPHAARDRFQSDTMLVARPDLDFGVRMRCLLLFDRVLEFF